MSEIGYIRFTPHALVGTVVFEFMHIGDEFAGNWAPFTPILDPTVASISLGIFVLVPLIALWMILTEQHWGYALSGAYGLFFFVVEFWHYFDPAHMGPFRWAVVVLAQLFALTCFVLSVRALQIYRPWRSGEATNPSG